MVDAQEEFDLKPRVTTESSKEELLAHIKSCHNRLFDMQEILRMIKR